MKSGPDFLCIGMQKAATRSLHSFLSLDDRFWMPLIKEFHHFDDEEKPLEVRHRRIMRQLPVLRMGSAALGALNLARTATGRRALTDLDRAFLLKYRAYLEGDSSDADYMNLFSVCPEGRVTGDITPAYSMLDASVIERVHGLMPEAQILLVIRDPVSRVWSHANMSLRKQFGQRQRFGRPSPVPEMERVVRSDRYLKKLVKRSYVVGQGVPSRIYRNWAQYYGDRIEVLSFEEVCTSQGTVADRIAALFGLPVATVTRRESGQIVRNRKAELAKVPMGDHEREFLVQHYRDELFACRELFGEEKTRGWLEKYGLA